MGDKASPTLGAGRPPSALTQGHGGNGGNPGGPTAKDGADAAATAPTPLPPAPAKDEAPFPPPPRRKGSLTLEETAPLWDSFRAGGVVACPCDGGALALSVDGAGAYRLVCTRCGSASAWFEALPAGLRDRTAPPQLDDSNDD